MDHEPMVPIIIVSRGGIFFVQFPSEWSGLMLDLGEVFGFEFVWGACLHELHPPTPA